MLKKAGGKSAKYSAQVEKHKTEAMEAREKLRELRSPGDQLRHKLERERKLGIKADKLREGIKKQLVIRAEADDEIEELRQQLHEALDEMQRIESEKVSLVGAQAAPVDFQQCVETMAGDLGEMFADPRLSQEYRNKKNEVEAGFTAMRALAATLSAIRLEYATCKQQAAAAVATPVAAGSGSAEATVPPTAETATGGGGATVPTEGTEATIAPAVATTALPAAAVSPVPDGPSEERSAARDRTPPPGSRAKEIAKLSDAEIRGPRKAKSKAAPKAAA